MHVKKRVLNEDTSLFLIVSVNIKACSEEHASFIIVFQLLFGISEISDTVISACQAHEVHNSRKYSL